MSITEQVFNIIGEHNYDGKNVYDNDIIFPLPPEVHAHNSIKLQK